MFRTVRTALSVGTTETYYRYYRFLYSVDKDVLLLVVGGECLFI